MAIYSILGSISTVVSFVLFLGIVVWAYSKERQPAFAEAANAPFALPEDTGLEGAGNAISTERQS